MTIGMTSLTFRNEEIPTVFEYAKKAGIQGIEWGVSEKHIRIGDECHIHLVKRLSEEYQIKILSLGSYCDMTDFDVALKVLDTAKSLGAPVIRLWAGNKGSDFCGETEYQLIVENTRKLADLSVCSSIQLGFEYHPYTLTDTADEAVRLVKRIGKANVGLYWQPQGHLNYNQNKEAFQKVKPYLCKNIHLNHYHAETGYDYLDGILEDLRGYFQNTQDDGYHFIIEFVKDSLLESLIKDVAAVRKIFG